ncbi:MAG: hypothetical protein NC185_08415, partial [Ruminococcus sp.]|nr:hypothetical protein [Ruminococcus sp.]
MFLDDLGKRLMQTGQDVQQKTKGIADIAKLNYLINEEEKKIEGIYLQIGKQYLEVFCDNYSKEFIDFVNEIKSLQEKITGYQDQIKKIKGVRKC